MYEIDWPIERQNIYLGKIATTDGLKFLDTRKIIFTFKTPPHRDIFGLKFEKATTVDLNYESPQYQFETLKTNWGVRPYKKLHIGFMPHPIYELDYLLERFGFASTLYPKDYEDILTTLFNGKFAYEYCEFFGYKKKFHEGGNNPLSWKNGKPIQANKYAKNSYQFIKNTMLTKYWDALNEVDYRNPEAIFTPLEEEGPIKKRILVGRDTNV